MDSEFAFFPKAASSIADDVDRLYTFLWLLTLVFATLIGALILYYAVKYRRANKVDRTKVPTSIWMEVFWIFAPLPILLLIFFWGADVFFVEARYHRDPSRVGAQVRYIAHREEGLTDGRRRELYGIGDR